jgi:hypothetical protein
LTLSFRNKYKINLNKKENYTHLFLFLTFILVKKSVLFIFIFALNFFQAQFYLKADSLNKKRVLGTTVLTSSVFSSSTIGLSQIWYSDYKKTKFHSFNDSKNWLQMDKVGHFYIAYHFSEQISKAYRWSGVNYKKSAIIGASAAWAYQYSIEMLDGKSSGWGFSWSDIAANTFGSSLYLGQELAFKKQLFKLKFSYFSSDFAQYRPTTLGSTFPEKLLKDYNAQTYWLSFSPVFYLKNCKFPKWINLSFGYGIDQKLLGDLETYTTLDGLYTFHSKREFMLSLDIDVKNLNIKKQWLKSLLAPFNSIKIPFPALVLRDGVLYGKAIY